MRVLALREAGLGHNVLPELGCRNHSQAPEGQHGLLYIKHYQEWTCLNTKVSRKKKRKKNHNILLFQNEEDRHKKRQITFCRFCFGVFLPSISVENESSEVKKRRYIWTSYDCGPSENPDGSCYQDFSYISNLHSFSIKNGNQFKWMDKALQS